MEQLHVSIHSGIDMAMIENIQEGFRSIYANKLEI